MLMIAYIILVWILLIPLSDMEDYISNDDVIDYSHDDIVNSGDTEEDL